MPTQDRIFDERLDDRDDVQLEHHLLPVAILTDHRILDTELNLHGLLTEHDHLCEIWSRQKLCGKT